jgi:hypothetical protein
MARPMPRLEPVTRATLPSSLKRARLMFFFSFLVVHRGKRG